MSALLLPAPQQRGFTLLEMLAVIGIILVLLALALPTLKSLSSTSVQVAARQVSSALQLSRQYAINNRAPVRFVIAVTTNVPGLRDDMICRAYTMCVASNDANGAVANWIPLEDWTLLPQGVVFSDLNSSSYNTINLDVQPRQGVTNRILGYASGATNTAWMYFNNFQNMKMEKLGTGDVSFVEFKPTGQVASSSFDAASGSYTVGGIRIAAGTVTDPSVPQVAIVDSNNWVYIEFDKFNGRVRTRYKDSYR